MKQRHLILCVDDNENNLFTLKVLLNQLDEVEILTAGSGREALNLLLKHKIDLVILDIQMPEMDGFEVAHLVKINQQTKNIPIVFLTAVYKSQEFIDQGYEVGAVDYLTKPIDNHLLINKINLYLSLFKQRDDMLREQHRFQHLAHSISEGIYVCNDEHHVVYINPKALDMLGYSEYEIIGKGIHELIHYHDINGKRVSARDCLVFKALESHQPYISDNEFFIRKDGSIFPVSISAAPIQESDSYYSLVVIFKDLTQIKEQELQTKAHLKIEQKRVLEQQAMINSLLKMIEQRDSYTAGHTHRVAHYCVLIAREMGYAQEQINLLEKAAKLHDIGKVATPDSILLKPGKLNHLEFKLIQEHLSSGYNILKDIPGYSDIAEIMHSHHERFDGKGYPDGKSAYDIPVLSRIMIVADAFDAMTTNRIYKPRMKICDAIAELKQLSEMQFHPEVVESAVRVLDSVCIPPEITQKPETIIKQERFAYFFKDRLTGLFFSDYLPILLRDHFNGINKFFLMIKLKNFSEYNRLKGWDKGDRYLQEMANFLNERTDAESTLFRIQGDDFLVLSSTPILIEADNLKKIILKTKGIVRVSLFTFESNMDGKELHLELEQFLQR
jgi:PAS domain S-box-containing protein/putative nucleotidyltransferase with HDIG domain